MIRKLAFTFFLIIPGLASWAQTSTLTGTIRDEEGNPLAYTSVLVKETNTGAVCDEQGRFTLQVPAGKALTITLSYI